MAMSLCPSKQNKNSDPCGNNALESQPSPFDWNDTVSFIIQADDRISVDIIRLADEFVHNEFTPIVLEWCTIRGVPSGGGFYLTDRIRERGRPR